MARNFSLLALSVLVGCVDRPTDAVRLEVEDILDSEEQRIVLIRVYADPGLYVEAGIDILAASPPTRVQSALASEGSRSEGEATVLVTATRVEDRAGNAIVRVLVRTSTSGGSAGGPSTSFPPGDAPLKDFIEVVASSGTYTVGDLVSLGTVRGKPLQLRVRKPGD